MDSNRNSSGEGGADDDVYRRLDGITGNDRLEQWSRLVRMQQQQQNAGSGSSRLDETMSPARGMGTEQRRFESEESSTRRTALRDAVLGLHSAQPINEFEASKMAANNSRVAMRSHGASSNMATSGDGRLSLEREVRTLEAELAQRQRLLETQQALQQKQDELRRRQQRQNEDTRDLSSQRAGTQLMVSPDEARLLQQIQDERSLLRRRFDRLEDMSEQIILRITQQRVADRIAVQSGAGGQRTDDLRRLMGGDTNALATADETLLNRLQHQQQQQQRSVDHSVSSSNPAALRLHDRSTAELERRRRNQEEMAALQQQQQLQQTEQSKAPKRQRDTTSTTPLSPRPASDTDDERIDTRYAVQQHMRNDQSKQQFFPMAEAGDRGSLSTFQALIRECLEYFVASPQDVTTPVQGRKRMIRLHQVGIRCKYCSHLLLSQRLKGAVNYPSTLLSVYQTAQNIAGVHLLNEAGASCPCVPNRVRQQLLRQRAQREPSRAGKLYWMNACKRMGIVEDDGALWMRKQRAGEQGDDHDDDKMKKEDTESPQPKAASPEPSSPAATTGEDEVEEEGDDEKPKADDVPRKKTKLTKEDDVHSHSSGSSSGETVGDKKV